MTSVWVLCLLKSIFFFNFSLKEKFTQKVRIIWLFTHSHAHMLFVFFCSHTKYFCTDVFQKKRKRNYKNTIKLFLIMHNILYALLNQICHIFHRLDIGNIKACYNVKFDLIWELKQRWWFSFNIVSYGFRALVILQTRLVGYLNRPYSKPEAFFFFDSSI